MNPNLPPELKELLWETLDSDNQELREKLIARRPELEPELESAEKMSDALRAARPAPPASLPLPVCLAPSGWRALPRFAQFASGAAVLVAVAFGANAILTLNRTPQPETAATQAISPSSVTARETQSAGAASEPQTQSTPPTAGTGPVAPANTPPIVAPPSPIQTPVTINVENTSLQAVLRDIATQAGLSLTLAPGLANPAVTIQYSGVPAEVIFSTLGQRFGFTAIPQGERDLLILPAREQNQPMLNPEGGRAPQDIPTRQSPPRESDGTLPAIQNP